MSRRHILSAAAVCALFYCATIFSRQVKPAYPLALEKADGQFKRDGQYSGVALRDALSVRLWGSWAGSDRNTGILVFGPFEAPRVLRFAVGGYPTRAGIQLYIERADTHAQEKVNTSGDVGEQWRIVTCELPAEWVGRQISIVARDASKETGGWLAVSEPISGGTNADLFAALAAWSINGLLLWFLWLASLNQVVKRRWVPDHWEPLVAAALVASAGYIAFWAYFANSMLGKVFSIGALLFAVASVVFRRATPNASGDEALLAAKLLLAICLFYVGLLHLFPSSLEFYALAANRWGALPGDNTLPHNVAYDLFRGESLRWPGADWQSSDRPPLQSGWQLLTWPVTDALKLNERTASGTASILLQSLWVFGAYGLFRTLKIPRWRTCAWVAVLSITGFFALNTVYTWPKLSAATFVCGAFCLWMIPSAEGPPKRSEFLLGGTLASLAWLSHGGVGFSFLAVIPLLACRFWRQWREWSLTALVMAVFVVPWFAYQKFYDPPSNRLLKWHLAGQIPKDTRGTWQTIRESYSAAGWSKIVGSRVANLKFQIAGNRQWWRDFSYASAQGRRTDEFFISSRALTCWLLGFAALPIAVIRRRRYEKWGTHAILTVWAIGTLLIWCLLMFIPNSAMNHQGSYAVLLILFVLLSTWFELASSWAIVVIAVSQATFFATTWAVSSPNVHGPLNWVALGFSGVGILGLIAVIIAEYSLSRRSRATR